MANNTYNKKGSNKDTKLVTKIMRTPIRVLAKARDIYVRSVSVNPKSITNDAEFKELIRMLSMARKAEKDLLKLNKENKTMPTIIKRSRTVAYGRIDEYNDECEFVMNDNFKTSSTTIDYYYPRSKSVAVGPKRTTLMF
ncbi:hypothetical protein ACFE04_023218 [Oxalis oulophora]